MILQVQDILKDAMGLIGVIEIDETPSSSEMATALRVANVMVDRWSSQRLLLRSSVTLSFPIISGKPSYTIGTSGCDVTAPKPIKVYSAYIVDSGNLDTSIEVIDKLTYDSIEDKDISTGKPLYVAFDPGATQQTLNKGTFYIYYSPDKNYILNVEVDNYLTEFVNLTDTVSFEPAYYEALIYNIGERLFRYYNDAKVNVPADISRIAANSLSNLRQMNGVQIIAGMELPGKISKYNIYTDGE